MKRKTHATAIRNVTDMNKDLICSSLTDTGKCKYLTKETMNAFLSLNKNSNLWSNVILDTVKSVNIYNMGTSSA